MIVDVGGIGRLGYGGNQQTNNNAIFAAPKFSILQSKHWIEVQASYEVHQAPWCYVEPMEAGS
jgi:hypothetical protein